MTTALFSWLPVALTWFTVLYRAPSARRSRAALFIWFTTLAVALAVTLDLPQVEAALDAVPNLVYLIKYSLVLTAAACVREALAYLPSAPRRRPGRRVPVLLAWAAAVGGMTAAWLVAPVHDHHVPDRFTEAYATSQQLIPLWVIYLGYLSFMLVSVCRDQLTYRTLAASSIRTGMLMIGLGAAVGLLYVAHKALYLTLALTGASAAAAAVNSAGVSTVFLGSSVLFLIGGGLWPALARLRAWWDNVVTYYALEPLWRLLTTAVPDVVLEDAGSQSFSQRTEGRLVEIRDALSSLPRPGDSAALQAAPVEHSAAVALLERVVNTEGLPPETLHESAQPSESDDDTARLRQLSSAVALVERGTANPLDRLARLLTNGFAPAHLVALSVVLVACAEAGIVHGLLWSLITLLFAPGIPLTVLAIGVRRHWWSDRHVRVRGQRLVPLTIALFSILACLAVLAGTGAPADLSALVIAMTAGLTITLAVTIVWKVSVHAAVAAGTAVVIGIQLGDAWGTAAALSTLAVGWSRYRLRDHTLGQIVAGTALGATVAASLFGSLAT